MPQQHGKETNYNSQRRLGRNKLDRFLLLVEKLHRCAKAEADSLDGNTSSYVWATLPMLVSGLTAFEVEQEAMLANQRDEDRVALLLKLCSV